jgi:DNA-binding Lrp family transcriptional regulator
VPRPVGVLPPGPRSPLTVAPADAARQAAAFAATPAGSAAVNDDHPTQATGARRLVEPDLVRLASRRAAVRSVRTRWSLSSVQRTPRTVGRPPGHVTALRTLCGTTTWGTSWTNLMRRSCGSSSAMHGGPTATSPTPSGSPRAPRSNGSAACVTAGLILGASLDLDLTLIGRPVQALIAVRIRPPSRDVIEAFRDWASGLPETIGLFVVSGNEDFLLHIAVADTDGLYSFVIDQLTQRREVADVRTSVVYEHVRPRVVEPLRQGGNGRGAAARAQSPLTTGKGLGCPPGLLPCRLVLRRPSATTASARQDRHSRQRHPARRRPPAPHRRRTDLRPKQRHPARPGPARHRRQRHQRRTPARPDQRPRTRLPTRRPTARPHTARGRTCTLQVRPLRMS